tara:strand:- start:7609 stop:10029 length:2421 start_codon:yes stop_codon:yes gene_type:complete
MTTQDSAVHQSEEFTAAIFEPTDLIEIRMLPAGKREWVEAGSLSSLTTSLHSNNQDGQNIYFGANPRSRQGSSAKDVATFRCLFVDFDDVSIDYARRIISEAALPVPTAEIMSGHGAHFYWRLEDAIEDEETWASYQRGMIAACGSDSKIKDAPRVMRLPGFLNVKYEPHKECVLLSLKPDQVCSLEDFPIQPLESVVPPSTALPSEIQDGSSEPHPATLYFMKRGAPAGERNSRLFTAACDLAGRGYNEDEAMNMLVRPAMNSGLTPTEIEQSIKSAYSKPRTARLDDEENVESCIQKMIHGTDETREKAAILGKPFRPTISNVADVGTGDEARRCYLSAPKICELIQESNTGWPRTVNGMLFAPGDAPMDGELPGPGSFRYITNEAAMFAYMMRDCDVRWTSRECVDRESSAKRNPSTKKEMYEYLLAEAKPSYQSVELLPHVPEVPGVYYMECKLPEPTGQALEEMMSMLNPETDIDRQLMLAALATPGWGGPAGTRPAFVFTSKHGRGVGKTTTASLICEIWGGAPSITEREDWEAVRARLLSDEALAQRCVLIDNLKSRLSRGGLEGAITARNIDGKKMYKGQFSRPNLLTWFITANTPSLSRDLAERAIIINIGNAKHQQDFSEWKERFMQEKRPQLISDLMAWLEGEKRSSLSPDLLDRWAPWQRALLERFDNADEIADHYQSLRPEVDSDLEESEEVANCIVRLLERRGCDPLKDAVRIQRRTLYQELQAQDVIDNTMSPKGCTTWIKNMMTLDPMKPLCDSKHTGRGRSWLWVGDEHDGSANHKDLPMHDFDENSPF